MAIDVKLTLQDQATRVYNQFVGNVNSKAATLDNTMKSLGTTIGAAFSIGAMVSFAKAAADAEAGTVALRNALKNTGDVNEATTQAFLDQADALKKKTAVDDDEIKRVQSLTIAMTGNAAAAMQLTPAILDLAQGMGISTEAAAKMFSKSVEGSEGLKKAGIVIGNTATEAERLAKISQAVEEKWGGAAAAFASTDAGKIKQITLAVEDLEKGVGKVFLGILGPSLPGIVKMIDGLAWAFEKTVLAIKVVTATIMTGLIAPFAAVENKLNELGISSSRTFQNFMLSGMNQTKQAALELTGGIDSAVKSTGALAFNTNATASATSDKLQPAVKGLTVDFRNLTSPLKSANNLIESIGANGFDSIQSIRDGLAALKAESLQDAADAAFGIESVWSATAGSIRTGMEAAFSGAEGAGKSALKALANSAINMAEIYLSVGLAQAYAKGIPSFGATLPGDFALVAAGTVALEAARAMIGTFHEGGTMGADGRRIPLQSDERAAILRVGETVIPTKPGESYGGGTVLNATININAPGTPVQLVMSALKDVARQIGANTLGDITVNQRNQIAFS
jgi:hypothetical protein